MYLEHTNSIQTEVGQLDIIYITEDDKSSVQLWLNKRRIHMPAHVLKQTSETIVRKVVQAYRTAERLGVRLGGDQQKIKKKGDQK